MLSRRALNVVPLAIIVALLLLVIPFHLRPENFIVDDGYFYPQIARFIVNGQGSTFNGVMPTNGYHPLWMLVCVAAASLTQRSGPLLQILSGIQDLMLLASVLLLAAIAREARLRGVWLGCLMVLFFNTVLGIWRLLESPLAFLLQIVALLIAVPCLPRLQQRMGRWQLPLLGLSLGLVMLARLDLIFFAATVLIYQMFRGDQRGAFTQKLWRILLPGAVASLVVLPYLLWNWKNFHHLLPISGAIKSTFPHVQMWGFPSFTYPTLFGILLNGVLLLKKGRTPFQTICVLSAVASALHLAYTLSFGGLAPWYLTTGTLSAALALTWSMDAVLKKLAITPFVEMACAAVLVILLFGAELLRSFTNVSFTRLRTGEASFKGGYVEAKRSLATRLDATLPPGSRMFIFDAPGGVAFFSHMNIVPVDGLVSDYAYNRELLQDGFSGYAEKHHIRYLIAPLTRQGQSYDRLFLQAHSLVDGERVSIQAPLTKITAGSIELSDKQLLFTFPQINPDLEKQFPEIGVWKLQP